MKKVLFAGLAVLLLTAGVTAAKVAPAPGTIFQKFNVYGVWSKQSFADGSIITGPTKLIFLAGMAAEDPNDGHILHQGDFLAQCRLAYSKIKKRLEEQGAGMSDIVRLTAYITDTRYRADYATCRNEALAGAPPPPHTFLNIPQLAWPGMLVEVEATAAIPAVR